MGNSIVKSENVKSESKAFCEVDKPTDPTIFQLLLDSEAFQYRMLMSVAAVRVSKLNLDGTWISEQTFTDNTPYVDRYVDIVPSQFSASMVVKSNAVKYLYNTKQRIQNVLCRSDDEPVLFIKLSLKKQHVPSGVYDIPDNTILLCGNEYILIVNLPDDPKITPPQTDITMDASILYLPFRPLLGRVE